MSNHKSRPKILKLLRILGPGLITGASDDDPSGIATYSQAGAKFGFSTLWMSLLTFPLMAAIQEMCARIGLLTSVGLTTTLKKHYSRPVLYIMMIASIPAIIFNIAADISAMGAVGNMIFPSIRSIFFSLFFTIALLVLVVFLPYRRIVSVLKYLCLSLFCYFIVPLFTKTDWSAVFKSTFIPTIKNDKEFIGMIVALLGTTISPYLFFWQVSMEAEDAKGVRKMVIVDKRLVRKELPSADASKREKRLFSLLVRKLEIDVIAGMLFSNAVMFFIILATGASLHDHGITQIDTVDQAAKSLQPIAGKAAYYIFALGVIGTGMLAIPVLSGSLSYIVSETFGWKGSLDKKFYEAKPFYIVLILSVLISVVITSVGMSPIKALVYTALLYGMTAPVLIIMILHIANNKKVMKEFTNGKLSNILGFATLALMIAAAAYLIYLMASGN